MTNGIDYYKRINSFANPDRMNDIDRDWVIKIINEARIDAIRACADETTRMFNEGIFKKQNILKLIEEVK